MFYDILKDGELNSTDIKSYAPQSNSPSTIKVAELLKGVNDRNETLMV